MSQVLKVDQVRKTYSKNSTAVTEALKGLSFDMKKGEIFGLLGPNGAGKTTLISCIATLEVPTSGSITLNSQDVVKSPIEVKRQLGVVPQEIVSQGFFNLQEIMKFQSGYYGLLKNKERTDYLLDRLGLWDHRMKQTKQLSGGMKRRLMIAKALVHSPQLLLLDEPTAGVDVELRHSLWNFVRDLQKEGVSVLLTTHYLQEAESLCERVGIINHGEFRFLGPTRDLITKYKDIDSAFLELTKKEILT